MLLLLSPFSRVQLCATPQMAAHQAAHPWDSPGKNTGVGCHFLLQCMKVKSLSRVRPSATPWTAAHQVSLPMQFSRQEYWSGVPLPSPTEPLGKPKEDIPVAKKHMKRCSASLSIREIQIKITMRCHLTPVRMVIIKKSVNNKCQRMWRKRSPPTLLVGR